MSAPETYPDDLLYHPDHDWARVEGDEAVLGISWHAQDALGELVHFEPPMVGATVVRDEAYAEIESVKAVSDVIAPLSGEVLEVNEQVIAEPETVNEDPYGRGWLARIKLSDPSEAREPAPPRDLPDTRRRAVSAGYLSLTEEDRAAMLEAIGVASIDDLFAQIPSGVRLGRPLDLPPPLGEAELVRHLEELASRNDHTGTELSFLGGGVYDHYVPAIVDYVLQRGEFLTAYTPYQPEMSQGVLQAIFEYQTAICELTGMDVSNASGYDGCAVAADACFVAKGQTGRDKVVLTETLNPQVRQTVRTYAPGFGMEVVEVAHDNGTTDPARLAAACEGAALAIFPQPNVFGVLEPAPDLAAAAAASGALPVAHVDLLSLGLLEAPGNYGCAMTIGEGQSIGCYQSYGGPHFGFLAAKQELIRRMPGRIVGETTDLDGERGFVLALQTREQHIRREKATSNITTNQTLLALGGLVTLCWLGPEGLRETGETCAALARYGAETIDLPLAFDRPFFKEIALRTPLPATEVVRRARALGVHPGYAIGRDLPGLEDVLLVAFTEKRTPADVELLAEVLDEVCR